MKNDLINTIELENRDPTRADWNILDALLIAVATLTIIILGGYLITVVSEAIIPETATDPFDSFFYVASITALESIAIIASIFFIGKLRRKLSFPQLGIVKTNRKWYLMAFISTLLLIPLISYIALLIQQFLGMPLNNPQLDILLPKRFSWAGAISTMIFGGIFVPVAEELFFRGILYQAIKHHFGSIFGAIISSIIFGALHGDISVAGATFVMGLILVLFYEKSKSIIPSMVIHITNNSLKLFILYTLVGLGYNITSF